MFASRRIKKHMVLTKQVLSNKRRGNASSEPFLPSHHQPSLLSSFTFAPLPQPGFYVGVEYFRLDEDTNHIISFQPRRFGHPTSEDRKRSVYDGGVELERSSHHARRCITSLPDITGHPKGSSMMLDSCCSGGEHTTGSHQRCT